MSQLPVQIILYWLQYNVLITMSTQIIDELNLYEMWFHTIVYQHVY